MSVMGPASELEQRVLAAAARVHAAQAELAGLLAEFEGSGGWRGDGIRSFGHWCDINIGVASRPADRLTAAAKRLEELPVLRAAFAEGALSVDKVLEVVDVVTPQSDGRFALMARLATVTQLRRICNIYRKVTAEESPEALERRRCRRAVNASRTDDGLLRIVAVLDADEAAIVLSALDARVETAWRRQRGDTTDTSDVPAPDLSVRRADALVELATEGLVEGPDPVVGGERTEVRVIVDAAVLDRTRPDGICAIDGVGAVPLATVERLLCDCKVSVAALLPDGSLDVGRAQRTVNRRQRRALQHRDKGCAFYGCPHSRFVQAHHVIAWEPDGRTDMDNLILLCPYHHRLFHEGGYTIEALGDGKFIFRRPDGRTIGPPPLRAPPGAAPPAPGDPRAQHFGARIDQASALDTLLRRTLGRRYVSAA